jgi:hypothetical protein
MVVRMTGEQGLAALSRGLARRDGRFLGCLGHERTSPALPSTDTPDFPIQSKRPSPACPRG